MYALLLAALALSEPGASHEHHDHGSELGRVSFETTCTPSAQQQFLRGLALLHSFQYEQAETAFNRAAAADPACSIAHWGVAMSLYHPLWTPPSAAELERGRAAVAKAAAQPARSARERDYVEAVSTFYRGSETLGHAPRAEAYRLAMAELHKRYPDDREAGVFYALSEIAAGTLDDDPTFAREKQAAGILNQVLAAEPDHPGVTHYLIHSFDYPPLAALAVPAAKRYAGIAPASPHAQHMPSHIFTRLGMWKESITSNLKSAEAARDWVSQKGFDGASREELHALDYLAYAYLQTGQDKAAQGVLDRLSAIEKVDDPNFSVAYAATAIPARLVLERRKWKEAAELQLPDTVRTLASLDTFRWGRAHIHFARAVGAARSGDRATAEREIAELATIERELKIPPGTYDWTTQVAIQRGIASAWLAHLAGNNEEALRLMRSAADLDDATEKHPVTPGAILPAREQLGELLLEMGQPRQALTAFEASLARAPLRLTSLHGAARTANLAGDATKATDYFSRLTQLTSDGDRARPEIEEARSALAAASPR